MLLLVKCGVVLGLIAPSYIATYTQSAIQQLTTMTSELTCFHRCWSVLFVSKVSLSLVLMYVWKHRSQGCRSSMLDSDTDTSLGAYPCLTLLVDS